MTEPAVGTDVLGMQTIARRDGDALRARTAARRSSRTAPRPSVVPRLREARRPDHDVRRRARRSPASRRAPKIPKLGMRASTMSELIFEDCRVPGREPARQRGRRHHEHDAQPRDRAARARGDEPRHRAALPRRDGAVRDRAPHVRQAARRARPDPALHRRELREGRGDARAGLQRRRDGRPDAAQPPRHRRREAVRGDRGEGGRRRRDAGARRLRLLHRVPRRAVPARREADRDRRRHARSAPEEHHARSDAQR